ncbi:eCIS core domain-containing protein [Streptomyces sp. NPDC002690]
MHSYETPSEKSARTPSPRPQFHRAGPGTAPTATTAASVLNLQRLAGNAAVTRMLGGEHEHGAGCHHGTPVQRSSVLDALRTPGTPVDPRIRAKAEQGLGTDLSDVRVHSGPEAHRSAAELGARAYTSGRHIVAGERGMDEHTLLHELTHTWQQQRGQVAGTDNGTGLRVSSPGDRHENEAESWAHLLAKVPARRPGAGERDGTERAAPAPAHAGPSIQRVPARDEEGGGASAGGSETTTRLFKTFANVFPEAAPLIVQAIGNAMAEKGTKVYASGVALNGAVGLGEIIRGVYRFQREGHVPSAYRALFGAMNLIGATTYGVSQVLEDDQKVIASAVGAAVQGLSYMGIIVTNMHIVLEDERKLARHMAEGDAGTSSAISLHSGQNQLRQRRASSATRSTESPRAAGSTRAPQLPMLDFGEPGLGLT